MPVYIINDILERYPEETREISRVYYEKEAREGLLTYLINNSYMSAPEYQRVWLEYIQNCIDYKESQKKFYETVILQVVPEEYKDKLYSWSLDFAKGELKFYDTVQNIAN